MVAILVACGGPRGSARPRAGQSTVSALDAARTAKNLDDAERHYRDVIARDSDGEAVPELIRLQLNRGLAGEAVDIASAYYTRRREPARAELYLDALFAIGAGPRALEVATELQAASPGAVADGYYARALLADGKADEARKRLDGLVVRASNARIHLWLAETASKLADEADRTKREGLRGLAIEQAGLALERDRTLLRAYLVLVDELQRGNDDRHVKLIAESLQSAADHVRSAVPYHRLVSAPISRDDRLSALRRALEIEPGRGTYWTEYARELRDVDPTASRDAYARAIAAKRPDFNAAVPLGPLLVEANELDAARALAAKIASTPAAHLVLGAIATREHKHDIAIRELDVFLRASDGSGPEAQLAQKCVAELKADEPRECTWFAPEYLAARRACGAVQTIVTVPRRALASKRKATAAERDAIAQNAFKTLRVTERGEMVRPSGERVAMATTRFVRGDDVRIDITIAGVTTRYVLRGTQAWLRSGVCKARELPADEREIVEDMVWRIPELLGARLRDRANRVDLIDTARYALTARSGAAVSLHVAGADIDELVYTDGSGTFNEKLEDWREIEGVRVPHRRRIAIYGNEALVLDIESVAVNPVLDDATFAP